MRHLRFVSFAALLLAIALPIRTAVADDATPSIVHLAFRDHIVTIHSSSHGPRYSVHANSGELLGDNLTDEQLLSTHPTLHSHIQSSFASDPSVSFIWAGRSEGQIETPETAITDTQ